MPYRTRDNRARLHTRYARPGSEALNAAGVPAPSPHFPSKCSRSLTLFPHRVATADQGSVLHGGSAAPPASPSETVAVPSRGRLSIRFQLTEEPH